MKYEIGIKIKKYRELKGLSQLELANKIGVSNSRLSNWEKGENRPDVEMLTKICATLSVSADELLELKENDVLLFYEQQHLNKYRAINIHGKEIVDAVLDCEYQYQKQKEQQQKEKSKIMVESEKDNIVYIKRYNQPASAGLGDYGDSADYEEVPRPANQVPKGTDGIAKISGDSMEPTYTNGAEVYFHNTNTLKNGDIGIFNLNGDNLIKEVSGDGLKSHNPKYKTIKISKNDSLYIIGKVLGKA